MITTTSNELAKPAHPDRMRVILTADDNEQWMTETANEAADLPRPYPGEKMQIFKSGEDEKNDAI